MDDEQNSLTNLEEAQKHLLQVQFLLWKVKDIKTIKQNLQYLIEDVQEMINEEKQF